MLTIPGIFTIINIYFTANQVLALHLPHFMLILRFFLKITSYSPRLHLCPPRLSSFIFLFHILYSNSLDCYNINSINGFRYFYPTFLDVHFLACFYPILDGFYLTSTVLYCIIILPITKWRF